MAEREYQRLTRAVPRSGFAVALHNRSSLWLGKEHLLCIDSNGFGETYKRFYFRDIQSISTRVTPGRVYWNWALAVPAAVLTLGGVPYMAFGSASRLESVVILCVIAVLIMFLGINNLLGSTCKCAIKTAVQSDELPSLRRLPKARKVIGRLRPLIAASQGLLEAEEIVHRLKASVDPEGTPAPQADGLKAESLEAAPGLSE